MQLERLAAQLSKGAHKRVAKANESEAATVTRNSATNLAALRKKLGRSAADFGKLIRVSGSSNYLWKEGKTRPRAKNIPAIAKARALGKKLCVRRLLRFDRPGGAMIAIELQIVACQCHRHFESRLWMRRMRAYRMGLSV